MRSNICYIFPFKLSTSSLCMLSKVVKLIKIGMHDGAFHCDEVFACVMLRTLPEFAKVLKSCKTCP